jgi:hypothetical protein
MQELKDIDTSDLIDMLARETATFTHLFRNYSSLKNNPEFETCKENIHYLIAELRNRRIDSTEPVVLSKIDQANSAEIFSGANQHYLIGH